MEPPYKIILLEDNLNDAELILRQLKKAGINFTPTVVNTATEYKLALTSLEPDVILSDYSLPGFNGLTAFHIKEQLFPNIPFIIISGVMGEEQAVELIKIGVDDYVLKDKLFTLPSKLLRAIDDIKKRTERKLSEEKLLRQHERLLAIAFLQSHQVRAPVANILGLINLFNEDDQHDPINVEVIKQLKIVTVSFDDIIRNIVKQTYEIKESIY